jgi:hypothetical protein
MFECIKHGFGPAILIALLFACVFQPTALPAQSVKVRYREGVGHGFLVLRTPDGKSLADGESTQVAQGDNVTSRMSFKFTDGSVYEQTTTFSQRGTFRLLKDMLSRKARNSSLRWKRRLTQLPARSPFDIRTTMGRREC